MKNDLPQQIWQDQPAEELHMTLNEIHQKAKAFQSKARLKVLGVMVIWMVIVVLFSGAFMKEHSWVPRSAWALMVFGTTFLAVQIWRWQWPRDLTFESAETCLRAYRRELEKQRDFAAHVWRRSGLPILFAGVALLVLPPIAADPRVAVAAKAAPFFVLLAIWFVLFIVLRRRKDRQLQREIDELISLERQSQ